MNAQRIKYIYSDFRKALERLKEALGEDISKSSIVMMEQFKDLSLPLN